MEKEVYLLKQWNCVRILCGNDTHISYMGAFSLLYFKVSQGRPDQETDFPGRLEVCFIKISSRKRIFQVHMSFPSVLVIPKGIKEIRSLSNKSFLPELNTWFSNCYCPNGGYNHRIRSMIES